MAEGPTEAGRAQGSGNARPPGLRRAARWRRATTLLAVFGAAAWLVYPRSPSPVDAAPFPGAPPHLFIEEVDVSATDDSGRMHRRLQAESLRREVPGGKSILVRPRLTVFADGTPMWEFTADTGEVSPDGENIYLPGPVKGRRGPARPIEIDSSDVRLMVADSYGESQQPSTIRGPAFQARGTGLKIWLDEGRVELTNDARGTLQKR